MKLSIPPFLKPLLTTEALFGWAIAFHQKLWRLIELGGDVEFLTTHAGKAWDILKGLHEFFINDWGTWLIVAFGMMLVGHSYWRNRELPAGVPESIEKEKDPASQYISPYAGKKQQPPTEIPKDIITVLDHQDEHIDAFLTTSHMWARRHFEAADPFIEINITIFNGSVYGMGYVGMKGRLFYDDQPLIHFPEMKSHSIVLMPGRGGNFVLRQFVSPALRDIISTRIGYGQEMNPSNDFCLRFSYKNRKNEDKEAHWTVLPNLFDISEKTP